MKTKADLHTHTIISGHAFSSLQEMVKAASEKGIEVLGITEHGPSIPGTCDMIYFRNIHVVPRLMYGVKLLLGCEINILDTDGTLDLNDKEMSLLDIRIAGIHDLCWRPGNEDENTAGVINVMRNPLINIISHPGDGTALLNFEELVKVSKETGTILEINNHSLSPFRTKREKAIPNNLTLLKLCKRYEVPVLLGSDAHISFQIADYSNLYPLLAQTEFPDELILNYDTSKLFSLLDRHSSMREQDRTI